MTKPEPIPMTPEEKRLWITIERLDGRIIKAGQLAEIHDMSDRLVRKHLKCLIEHHGCPIGSRTGKPAGYYLITDPEGREEVYLAWRKRGISILARAAKLRGIPLAEELERVQLELGLKEGEAA
ncbi:hypothetical protein MYX64_06490 [Nitrospinae bacterium AH_259_B05_G02_I21]|nr:hypothetical protein [Nitrospinae bacterium AH_259_B05_G02_I21]